mmetsp:Transcript_29100/g.53048  ORF Transcript_29100/g.53048 Transcript_29100/m.53048 type:complete len:517 (+) Transcript_29100:114-1664(+)
MSTHAADVYHDRAALLDIARRGIVRLVRGEYLIELYERSEPVKRRQSLPEEAFVSMKDLDNERLEIVAVSYCWCEKEHPDRSCYHLPVVAKMVKAMMAGKHNPDFDNCSIDDSHGRCTLLRHLHQSGFRFGASSVAIFWDFMSLPQDDLTKDPPNRRTAKEEAIFKQALDSINAWYGSTHVTKLILTDLPADATRKSYHKSGWTCFEREVANVITPPSRMLTLTRRTSAYERLDKDHFGERDFIVIALRASQAGQRSGPMLCEEFERRLEGLTFTNGSDKKLVAKKYREAFSTLVEKATSINFSGYNMSTKVAEEALQLALKHCTHLDDVDLSCNPGWIAPLDVLMEKLAAHRCTLRSLHLAANLSFSGDVGCIGSFVNLRRLKCSGLVSIQGTGPFSGNIDSLSCLASLEELDLSHNEKIIGDVGGLSGLRRLQQLHLHCTKVSGDIASLSSLVNLQILNLGFTEVSGDIGALSSLQEVQDLNLNHTLVHGEKSALRRHLPKAQIYCAKRPSRAP